MAGTLIAQWSASTNSDFLDRVTIALLQAAQDISTEPTSTANHSNRVALMKQIANAPAGLAPQFALLLASQGLDDTATDAQIQAMVSACWNTMAGVP